jgi:peptidoglycan hydrolase CwlO-like protein
MKKLIFTILILFLGINLYAQKTHIIKEDTAFIYVDSKATLAELQEENKSLKVNIVILNNNIKDLQNEIKEKENELYSIITTMLLIIILIFFHKYIIQIITQIINKIIWHLPL